MKKQLLGDLMSVNTIGLFSGIAGICIVVLGAYQKDNT